MSNLIPEVFSVLLPNIDHAVALWFHQHLTASNSNVLLMMSDPGSSLYVGTITVFTALLLAWKRLWNSLAALGFTLPGGMLVNQIMKITIQRSRPFQSSPYLDVGGYSFPSGHTMAAALLYGLLAVFVISMVKRRRWRLLAVAAASLLVLVVAFSRVALGAHYVTDVLGAMLASLAWLYVSLGAAGKMIPKPVAVAAFHEQSE